MRDMQFEHTSFQVKGQLPPGKAGKVTLERLTGLGLLETGAGRWGDIGWRISDDGWRCMYGATHSEIMTSGVPHHPLKVWSWPPTPDNSLAAPGRSTRLTAIPPRLLKVQPPLKPLRAVGDDGWRKED